MSRIASLVVLVACGSHAPSGEPGDAGRDAATAIDAAHDAAPRTCGVRADRRGLTHRTAMVDGIARTYLVYLPGPDDPATPAPLVLVFHGYTMSGQDMYDVTQYAALADREHVAVAFPDGQGGPSSLGAPWNVGPDVCPSFEGVTPIATGNDFGFIDAIKADVATDQCLDAAHEFTTGFSMGGYFTHHTACMRDDVAGAAPASGGTHDLASCPGAIKPIIIFHGDSDAVIPTGCDDPDALPVIGREAAATAWARHNGCAMTTTKVTVDGGGCKYFDGCPAHAQVAFCSFDAMGHCWAGGPQSLFGCPAYAKTTELEWAFFKQYAW